MRTLFLDLASHNGLLACVIDTEVVASREADHRIGDHELVPLLEGVLSDAGWTYSDLTQIACVTGPGGFTSLRVGVTAANTLAWSLKIPIAGIHLSDLYAARADGASFLWLHSTKKQALFLREFGNEFSLYSNPTLLTLDGVQTFLKPAMQWVGELIPEHQEIVDAKKLTEATLQPVQKILPHFLSSLEYSGKPLEPWYGRGW